MSIRWRIGLVVVQLAVLSGASFWATGTLFPFSIWFVSGLLGVVLALQLAEPFFTRPTDVLISGISVLLLILVADKTSLTAAWWSLGIYSLIGVAVATLALVARRDSSDARGTDLSFRSYQLIRVFSGKALYSGVFVVAVIDDFNRTPEKVLILTAAWAVVIALATVRWDRMFLGSTAGTGEYECFGLIAPAKIVVTAGSFELAPGTAVEVTRRGRKSQGYVTRRLPRRRNILIEVQLASAADAEYFVGHRVMIKPVAGAALAVGVVGPGTTDELLVFDPLQDVSVGSTLIGHTTDGREILHQVAELRIVEDTEKPDGVEQLVRGSAVQVGEVDADGTISLSRQILHPGATVTHYRVGSRSIPDREDTFIELGALLDTDLPVWLDADTATRGHIAILGMTGMGKSAFARRLARHLAKTYPVVVVDQTGEYREMGLPASSAATASVPGLTLKDLENSSTPHKEALKALKAIHALGRAEFATGVPIRRVLILEEAHQFVPEPSMLGFNAPGREESIEFGLLMMQVRKFGVSVILISQRTAVVAKSALSQCENIVAFKNVDQTGLDYLEAIGGPAAKHLLPRLRMGEAVLMGPAISVQTAVGVKVAFEPDPVAVDDGDATASEPAAGDATPQF